MSQTNNNNNGSALVSSDALLALLGGNKPAAAGGETKEKKPTSLLWLNIGINVPQADGTSKFISLPYGLALDDMKDTAITGNKQEWHQMVEAKNTLLKYVREVGGKLDAGSEAIIPGLAVQILRRADGSQAGPTDANPLITGMLGQLGG